MDTAPFVMRRIPSESLFSVAADRKWLAAEEYAEWLEAGALVDRARQEVEELRDRAIRLCEEERTRGYREGQEAAAAELAEQRVRMAAEMTAALESLEKTAVEVVMDCLTALLGDIPQEAKIVALVRRALQAVRKDQKIVVRVAPDNAETLRRRIAELADAAAVSLEVAPDPAVGPASCLLETPTGWIEADLENQVRSVRRALYRAIGLAEEPEIPAHS